MRQIVVLEDDEDLRQMLCQLLRTAGAERCLPVASVAELKANEADVMTSHLAILDVNLGPGEPSGLDAFAWLKERGFGGQIVFLTGHARSHPLVKAAYELPNVKVFEKPMDPRKLKALAKGEDP